MIRSPRWASGSETVTFIAPGSTWYEGKPSAYQLTLDPQSRVETVAASAVAGAMETLHLPPATSRVRIQAVGPSGLLGEAVRFQELLHAAEGAYLSGQ